MSLTWLKAHVARLAFTRFLAGSLWVLAAFSMPACGGDDKAKAGVAKGCTLNSDCNGGLVCSFGLCHTECEKTEDCPAGQRCVQTEDSNVCQLKDESQCHFNTDCPEPLVCAIDLQCRNQCNGSADCLDGQECADHVCAEPGEVDDAGGLKNVPTGEGGAGPGPGPGNGGEGNMTAGGAPMGEGGAPATECTAGGECHPDDDPCQLGSIACEGGEPVCVPAGDAEDGVECGSDKVCSGGECVGCVEDASCAPEADNPCKAGQVSCAMGPTCDPAGNVKNGTACGNGKVCSAGACVACEPSAACEPPGEPCKDGALSCTNGPVCVATTSKAAGTSCGADMVCDSSGSCAECQQGGACTPANECHSGQMDCATGPNCVDTGLPGNEGASCTGPGNYNFCTSGSCLACQNNNACVPTNPCHKGTLNCATNPPTCNDAQQNVSDGTSCGANKSCISGSCVTNDRVLSVTSGDPPDVAIDAAFAPVTVKLVDSNDTPVAGAQITVTASEGAYAVASSTTNGSGNAQIGGRVGRSIGTHTFTVSAPGATAIQFTVDAVAPTAGNIFTLVNVDHLSGKSTAPGAGTVSKLQSYARAVTAASDGTLYIASYCAVFALSPKGELRRVAGDANETCGFSGDSGPGDNARVYNVADLALDETNGYLYIADYSNYRVRQVDLATGYILTYAGGSNTNAAPWGDGFPADTAYLLPSGVSLSPNGDLYISDYNSSRVRKVDHLTGIITSYLTSTSCSTTNPLSFYDCGGVGDACNLAWDADGTPFLAAYFCGDGQSSFRGVARIEPDKSLTRVAGAYGASAPAEGGVSTTPVFPNTPDIAFDKAGDLYLATPGHERVRRVDAANWHITTVAGTGTAGYSGDYAAGNAAQVSSPTTVSFDGDGTLYFADNGNYAVRGLWHVGGTTPKKAKLATVAGSGQTVSLDQGFGALTVKVTDANDVAIQGVGVTWQRQETGSGLGASGDARLTTTTNVSGASSMTGRVGLSAGDYTFKASHTDIHGKQATGSPQTFTVAAAAPNSGIIFPVMNYAHTSGNTGVPGPATYAKLYSSALGVVAASDGTIYASDHYAIYKITPRGEVSLFAGVVGSAGYSGDSGPAVGAKFYNIYDLALDEDRGLLYVADYSNKVIRVILLSNGYVSTYAGGGATVGTGPATGADIGNPSAITVGPDGTLYISENNHDSIWQVNPDTQILSAWLTCTTTCTAGVVSMRYLDQYGSRVRFTSNGKAYVGGYVCNGVNTSYTLGILHKDGATLTHIAGLNTGVTTDGALATGTLFNDLSDFVIDANGNLLISQYTNEILRLLNTTTGTISTVIGDGTAGYAGPGDVSLEPGAYVAASGVRVYYPFRLANYLDDHVLMSDQYNQSVRMVW